MNICQHLRSLRADARLGGMWEEGGKTRLPSADLHFARAAFPAEPTVQLQSPVRGSRVASIGIQFMNH